MFSELSSEGAVSVSSELLFSALLLELGAALLELGAVLLELGAALLELGAALLELGAAELLLSELLSGTLLAEEDDAPPFAAFTASWYCS